MTESDDNKRSQARARPGREMKKIREQAGITLAQIAERTLISEARLNALENDDYDNVGSVAYITGYARAYAKVVGFNPSAHVEALEQAVGFEREQVVAPDVDYKPIVRRKVLPPLTTLAGAALGLIILVLALGYWMTGEPEAPPARAQSNPVGADTAAAAEPGETISSTSDDNTGLSTTTVNLPVKVLNRDDLPVPEPSTQDLRPTLDDAPVVEPGAAGFESTDGAEAASSLAADSGPQAQVGELVIEFHEECWLRVVDGSGNRLIENVRQAGDTLRLSGPAPFNIRLGNARAVDIEFNGDAVPVRPRPGQRTLELSVGG